VRCERSCERRFSKRIKLFKIIKEKRGIKLRFCQLYL
jgi:hypothetical protein